MRKGSRTLGPIVRGLFAAALLTAARPAPAADPVVQPPFAGDYTLVALGEIPGVHAPYGALTFELDTADQILAVGFAGTTGGLIYGADLTRDVTGSISGFAGTATPLVADAYGVGGGVAYGPEDVLFYSRVQWEMGEVKSDSTTTDKVVSLRSVTYYRPSGLTFVPPGFPGAGQLKLTSFNGDGDWYSLSIAPDGTGTYNVTGATKGPALPGYPEGFTYVPAGLPGFPNPSIVVCEYANAYGIGKLTAYDVDQNGNPVLATRREIVTGLDVPYGIATDPATGDLLWTSYQGFAYVLRKAPVPPTTTTSSSTSTTSSTSTSTTARPTTTSSTTLRPTTTSTTVAPTTSTSSTTTSSTTTSTTIRPTTTSSTTIPPTTTSTSIPRTTTSITTTTTTSSTTTTTTIPPGCTAQPSFRSLACRVDALLDLVRASSTLGPLQSGFVTRCERAQQIVGDGAEECAAGQRTPAREALGRLERQMLLIRARTRTHRARKIIPAPLAALIADGARSIGVDADALRGTLTCP